MMCGLILLSTFKKDDPFHAFFLGIWKKYPFSSFRSILDFSRVRAYTRPSRKAPFLVHAWVSKSNQILFDPHPPPNPTGTPVLIITPCIKYIM